MSLQITMIVLLAAILNASWNALVKVSGDKIAVMAVITLLGSLFSTFVLPFVQLPAPDSWPLLTLAILLHTTYHFCLPIAYNYGDFGQVYPIARGVAPLLVTIGSVLFAGEILNGAHLIGVVALAFGIIILTWAKKNGQAQNPRSLLFAIGTGIFIASYTLVDGIGARQSGSALGFAVCLTIGNGLLTFLIALIVKYKEIVLVLRSNFKSSSVAGVMQVGAYWIVIWAMTQAPLSIVSALRETSVLFAVIISTFILKEGFGLLRFISAALIVFGIFLNIR
ncbi:transporter [Brenneria goodwinii]|uniref:Transporter n=1 Tax=Brenneria goodwinii TaxID=1109412 RepID=A0AAE8JLF9_9GAMM|nr:EamA family transporter [Brenneria goodwinii]ATA26458.1 transporter [Brenneria goodwinii]RLM15773.1 transporter [Brenneria goodwinii]